MAAEDQQDLAQLEDGPAAVLTETVKQLKSQISALSAAERAYLAYFLLTSLEPEEEGVAEDRRKEIAHCLPITDAQKQDLQRRLADYKANRHAGAAWEEVKTRLQERG